MSELRRIGLNLLFLVPGETGGSEIYVRQLIPKLAEARPDLELVAFVNRELAGTDLGVSEVVEVDVSGRERLRRVLAEQRRLSHLARRSRIDLLHSPGTSAPRRPGVVSVVTILDVIYARHPEAHTLPMRLGMRVIVPLAARGADRVITISDAAAADISDLLSVPPDRIDVTHLGGRPIGRATPEPELRRRLGLADGAADPLGLGPPPSQERGPPDRGVRPPRRRSGALDSSSPATRRPSRASSGEGRPSSASPTG